MAVSRANLHAVQTGEKPATARKPRPKPPKTITQAASSGTMLELLIATRNRIAKAVENENTPARDLAALSKRLMELTRDIAAIEAQNEQETGAKGAEVTDEAFTTEAI